MKKCKKCGQPKRFVETRLRGYKICLCGWKLDKIKKIR